ncbi:arginase family protein [Rapidithrix thailandica]|uniref:Arginase family protein n=1 Tax=Rapidithrix thailandica TaxID=413964 RepID=A0AAW9S3D7_9BACT
MNSHIINLFEFPSNLGLKKTRPELEPGVKKLPSWFRKHHFHERIQPEQIFTLNPPEYSMDLDEKTGVRNVEKIINYAEKQAALLSPYLRQGSFQLILGGDCSIMIGNAIALRQQGNYGLFYLDGHTDFMLPDRSQTGGAAGMDLAFVTGYGPEKLSNILHLKPYIQEQNVWCVGNREYDPGYVQPILESGITYLDLKTLRATGMQRCTTQFLQMVEAQKLDGFFIHLDVDVLDDAIMPAVDSREKDGLSYPEFNSLLYNLLSSPKAIGMEITILDPHLDKDGKYTTQFISEFITIIEAVKTTSDNSK